MLVVLFRSAPLCILQTSLTAVVALTVALRSMLQRLAKHAIQKVELNVSTPRNVLFTLLCFALLWLLWFFALELSEAEMLSRVCGRKNLR